MLAPSRRASTGKGSHHDLCTHDTTHLVVLLLLSYCAPGLHALTATPGVVVALKHFCGSKFHNTNSGFCQTLLRLLCSVHERTDHTGLLLLSHNPPVCIVCPEYVLAVEHNSGKGVEAMQHQHHLVAACQNFVFLAGPDQCEVPSVLTHPAGVTLPIPTAVDVHTTSLSSVSRVVKLEY